jgi:TusA-related sulfurtransferase
MPIVKAKKELTNIGSDEVLKVVATDRGSVLDFQGWAKQNPGFRLLEQREETDDQGRQVFVHLLARAA